MTLVLSIATPFYCLQVSDRQLTAGETTFDKAANKTVLFGGEDGIVVLSYTGAAYLRGVPTDTRIAGALTAGEALKGWGSQFGPGVRVRDVGSAMRDIRGVLQGFPSFARSHGEVVAVGWQWRRKRPQRSRQVLWEIGPNPDSWVQQIPRRPEEGRAKVYLATIGDDPFSPSELQFLVEEVAQKERDVEAVEALLVEAIRKAASRRATIGPNCMSVLLNRGKIPRIRFIPQEIHVAIAGSEQVEIGFCPWVIGKGTIVPPSHLVGSHHVCAGTFCADLEGPEPPDGQSLMGSFGQQKRPIAPGYLPHPHASSTI